LAESSIALEDEKEESRRTLAKRQKEIDEGLDTISKLEVNTKKSRVKTNQLENDLEYQLKRLTIICKSKGLARPSRPSVLPERAGSGTRPGAYVSPYGKNRNASNASNNSTGARQPLRNSPGVGAPFVRKPVVSGANSNRSNSLGKGSTGNNRFYSPVNDRNNVLNRTNLSNSNKNSQKGSPVPSRLYSPSGRMRNSSNTRENTPPRAYAAKTGQVNRVRREGAVAGSANANRLSPNNSARNSQRPGSGYTKNSSLRSDRSNSNSRTRAADYARELAQKKSA
jgi:hypothetical protein